MNENKKVYMILTNGFDPDVRVYKEAKYLASIGYLVEILCWDRKCEYLDRQEEEKDGFIIKRFPIKSTPGTGMKQLLKFIKFSIQVKKYLKNKKYEYLHCHDFDGILVGLYVKSLKRKNMIFDMHEIYEGMSYSKMKIFKKLFNYSIKKSDYVIYVNNQQLINIERQQNLIDKNKLIFLPNYPEEEDYIPVQKNKSEQIRINYIGAIRDYTALKTLIDVGNKNLNFKIGLYGNGVKQKELSMLKHTKNVSFYGKYDGIKEISEIYRNTDILYCVYDPQNYNWKTSFPVKFYESIITATPVIVAKNTDIENFVKINKNGESVEYGNAQELEKTITKIIDNYNDYEKNIQIIKHKYTWKDVEKNLDMIYRKQD